MLLSATLNEKVNHLAKISLDNPVMIGLDDRKTKENPSHQDFESIESDIDEDSEFSRKTAGSANKGYRLPAQLVQKYVKGMY